MSRAPLPRQPSASRPEPSPSSKYTVSIRGTPPAPSEPPTYKNLRVLVLRNRSCQISFGRLLDILQEMGCTGWPWNAAPVTRKPAAGEEPGSPPQSGFCSGWTSRHTTRWSHPPSYRCPALRMQCPRWSSRPRRLQRLRKVRLPHTRFDHEAPALLGLHRLSSRPYRSTRATGSTRSTQGSQLAQ
ncbi:hypothetical protein K466DRAFT_34692 [Polyporus arcularius HHB13444]|uniref:Uncharacterized protein n=1 Tax=Polyporus arcularius HHB13444 TaxID=1314778 RepID=A0A5C3NRC1_9APHY|nr:hypothetical protein K466DRAFT_34692 [Polyporus arcularius HHB13444]